MGRRFKVTWKQPMGPSEAALNQTLLVDYKVDGVHFDLTRDEKGT